MSDWWSQKLTQRPAPSQPSVRPAAGPARSPYWQAQPAPPQEYVPVTTPTAPPQGFYSYDSHGQRIADDGHMQMLHDAAAATGGSRAAREGTGRCPECGSGNYFSRDRTENGMPITRGVVPSPQCFDCGYPIIQAGSAHGGATMAGSRGGAPAGKARQLAPGHAVSVNVNGQTMIFPDSRH